MASLTNLLGFLMGPMGTVIGMGDGRPDNSQSDMKALTDAYAAARAKRLAARQGSLGSPDPAPAAQQSSPTAGSPATASAPQLPWWVNGQNMAQSPGFPQAPQQAQAIPMPQARPAGAPQAAAVSTPQAGTVTSQPQPDTGFFMRNALMMQDPSTGQYIDPQGASSVRGPDLINKMTAYLHNKDMG